MNPQQFASTVRDWYAEHARDLPWREPDVTPWGVLVSEVMLQQTPAARVAPAWREWMARWPTPADLAAAPPGEAVRQWGRLGYPRRALRLHATAVALLADHGGIVPADYDELRALPGVGSYTAAAVAAFGYGTRQPVLDTNVRRVYARFFDGKYDATTTSPTVAERAAALNRVPREQPERYSVAVMELGALLCTAQAPRCAGCPLAGGCAWLAAGKPPAEVTRKPQPYAGTDRQVRGRLLAVLRDAPDPVWQDSLVAVWDDATQRERALAGLLDDGLVQRAADGRFQLPR
ncbi:MAG TPA: A/G-specific adenine glycosylase [Mycobacteriales bacterium]|nr:A/G-specific adenine glycosylase [Mycobacteriales bacterium]